MQGEEMTDKLDLKALGLEFTAEDFCDLNICEDNRGTLDFSDAHTMSKEANRLLQERLKAAVTKVYGNKHQHLDVMFWQSGTDISGLGSQTHEAYLIGVRKIVSAV